MDRYAGGAEVLFSGGKKALEWGTARRAVADCNLGAYGLGGGDPMSTAVKLSDELTSAARAESEVWSRSMTQQIEHWARIGRAVERGGDVRLERVRSALQAELPFDELGTDERLVVLGELERRVMKPGGDPILAGELRGRGGASVADDGGVLPEVDGDAG